MALNVSLPSNVHQVSHPLLAHNLSNLRLESTNGREFRGLLDSITSILVVEASRDLQTHRVTGKAPLREFEGDEVAGRIGVVPILRAGSGMVASALALLPADTSVLHIGLFREKVSLQPVEYYSKLPAQPSVEQVFILDPLIATGGTAAACVSMMLDWGLPIEKIRFVGVLGSEVGVKDLATKFPGLSIWIGQIDPELSQPEGYILPGLGDMGDRLFQTL